MAPLLLTGFHLTPMPAGYGTHLEARREVLTPGRTPDFCLFSQVVQKKRLRQPYPEYGIRMLLDHSSRCGFTPYLLRMGIQNRFSGIVNKHLNHKTCGNPSFHLTFFMKNGDRTIICSDFQTGIKAIYLLKRRINLVFSFLHPLPFPTRQSRF